MVPCCLEAFSFDTPFESFVLAEQIEDNAVKQGEILGGVSGRFSAQIFAEGHVQHPVQFVLNAPVLADELVWFSRATSGFKLVM